LACLWFSSSIVKSQQQEQEMNCTVQDGELPEIQSGLNNFVIDMLDSFTFPFALKQCTAISLLPTNKWYTYECNMDIDNPGMSTVTKTEYNDATCSDAGLIIDQFFEPNMTEGAKGFFDCSGADTYIEIELSLSSQCQDSVIVYAALGSCSNFMNSSSSLLQMNLYCNENEAVMQIFNLMNPLNATMSTFEPFNTTSLNETSLNETSISTTSLLSSTSNQPQDMLCADESFCDKWMLYDQCDMVTLLPFVANQTLYGRLVACVIDVAMTTTDVVSSTGINATTDVASTYIEATGTEGETTTTTRTETTRSSSAVRPSFLFTTGLFLVSSFLFFV